ncbi:solute carrier family 13 member 2 isoform X1 [Alligator mississippiensis]|uniref:Solute carrier family 13 member 5 n=2 Tax=Alligator mississippiensis TaxID=8496 RepID=A0A151NWR8_ALLMI|nr:solute carrier family 13 member 2 isoform X1 [Alligator mississippiensis]XP_019341211.1 solute carrier family 13 member 2 isoform X1 [Alligator mississippiensis]KYO40865.1 solute carrier family 13 member 5 [Alligator mississippiensis]
MATLGRTILAYRNYLIILLTPIVLLPLPLVIPTKEARCGYVIILMALFWCTEALPLAITALFPVLLFPLMDIMDSTQVCMEYLKDTNMLFIGGLMVAIAVEHWNLHKRIALRVLLIIGVRPALLLMGFMIVTAFLSMWISNTATTAMMVPIAQAVLEQLHKSEVEAGPIQHTSESINKAFELQEGSEKSEASKEKQGNGHVLAVEDDQRLREEEERLREEKHLKNCKGMSLSVCYASSIGGIATLTGTTPNLVMKGQVDELFPENGNVVNFASWFTFAFPTMLLLLLLSWIWLQVLFLGFNFAKNFGCTSNASEKTKQRMAYTVIKEEHKNLGSMKFAEIAILFLFVALVLLWFTRDPGFMTGWATYTFTKDGKSYVTDATVVIFISLLMFIIPSEVPSCFSRANAGHAEENGSPQQVRVPPPLLQWKTINEKMAWNIVILLGGGFALAKGSEESGLSLWLGNQLTPLQNIPPAAIALLLCLLVATFTECTSNVATTTLFLPILASMAQAICLHPLYVMLPCTLSSSLAFMLPVATPPNAIVFSYGQLKVLDMAKAGFMLNILGVLTITLSINTWGYSLFQLHTFPAWANSTSATCL